MTLAMWGPLNVEAINLRNFILSNITSETIAGSIIMLGATGVVKNITFTKFYT